MRFLKVLVLGIVVIGLVWFVTSGCGEKATTPEMDGVNPSGLGAIPDAAGMRNRVHDIPSEPGLDVWDTSLARGTLLVTTDDGLVAIPPDGSWFILSTDVGGRSDVEVMGTRIFTGGAGIYEFDLDGNLIDYTRRPPEIPTLARFNVLPDGGFAAYHNNRDSIYFMGADGTYITTLAMPDSSPHRLQNCRGMVEDNTLIISETGTWKIMEVDLTTYEVSIFKDLFDPADSTWLSDIDEEGGTYYLGRPRRVQTFVDGGPPSDLCDFGDEYNVTGIVAEEPYLYVVLNFTGKVYRVNMVTGAKVLVAEGLNRPHDIELLPVVLEEPPA